MDKIEKLIPEKISLAGHRVSMSEKLFGLIFNTLNTQTSTINQLIEYVSEHEKDISTIKKDIDESKEAIKTLAKVLKVYTEE